MVCLACRASEKCQKEKRKTINGDDLLYAIATLGFEDYMEPLKVYLGRYREVIFLCFLGSSSQFPVLFIYLFFNFVLERFRMRIC